MHVAGWCGAAFLAGAARETWWSCCCCMRAETRVVEVLRHGQSCRCSRAARGPRRTGPPLLLVAACGYLACSALRGLCCYRMRARPSPQALLGTQVLRCW
jgi:hypothetical protein